MRSAALMILALGGAAAQADTEVLPELTVVGAREELSQSAMSASEGIVPFDELQLTPEYRPGQLLETVPGLIVTLHSGEGKANQFLLRGYNLDHGTDLETTVDGMPVNQPTHAHGQGYTDLNFLIPELADTITYTKGPYYADIGDFGAVGSVHVGYRDALPDELALSAGTLGFERLYATASDQLGEGRWLGAAEVQHYDGPFSTPDDARRENGVLRFSSGDATNGYSLTGMLYHQIWTSTTDIPERAISEDLVADRFGTLDPTDGGHALRASLSANAQRALGTGELRANAFVIDNELHLYSDFTHFLIDPVHGDQEDQFENRHAAGFGVNYTLPVTLASTSTEFTLGGGARYDELRLGRLPSEAQVPLAPDPAHPSYSNDDQVTLGAAGLYLQADTQWTRRFRSVLGLRDDFQHGTDVDNLAALHTSAGYSNGGSAAQSLVQPKASLIYAASDSLDLYLSAGRGFHSADLRGVNQDRSVDLGLPHTPLLARQEGQELGVRGAAGRRLTYTVALYNLWQQSETIIDPDVGQDSAGPPSRRYGYEVNLTWQLSRALELYASYSGDHTRFTHPFDDGTGHLGEYITDAPRATGLVALYLRDVGPWSAGLNYRYLGGYPLSSGPCVNAAAVHDFPGLASSCANAPTAPGQVNASGFGELNLDVHYAFSGGWSAAAGLYNLLNTHAAAAEFWYVDRLQGEIGAYPLGRADVHEHPLEPFMLRLTIARRFGPGA